MNAYFIPTGETEPNATPYGYCRCGCGQRTPIASRNRKSIGHIKGEPVQYVVGHAGKVLKKDRPEPIVLPDLNIALLPVFGEASVDHFAIVDLSDLHLVAPFRWTAQQSTGTTYATTRTETHGPKVYMHRLIFGAMSSGKIVDHRNMNGLDNRRFNLREATHSENHANAIRPSWSFVPTSRFKGVAFNTRRNKWQAAIHVNGSRIHLGLFGDEMDAALAYDNAAVKYFGEFARLNFPEDV